MSVIEKKFIWGYVPSTVLGAYRHEVSALAGKSGNREVMTYHKNLFYNYFICLCFMSIIRMQILGDKVAH